MRGLGWHGLPSTETGVVLCTLAAAPFAVLAVLALVAARIGGGGRPGPSWRRSLAEVGMVWGTLPGLWLTMLPGARAGEVVGAVSLVPFRDLPTMSDLQVVGNLLIFAAFGLIAPLRFPALGSVWRVTAVAALGSMAIETAQYVLVLDRVSSVDDVFLNASGAGLAAAVTMAVRSLSRTPHAMSPPGPTVPGSSVRSVFRRT